LLRMLVMYNPYDVFPDRTIYCVGVRDDIFVILFTTVSLHF